MNVSTQPHVVIYSFNAPILSRDALHIGKHSVRLYPPGH
jgi:hypothetical protein